MRLPFLPRPAAPVDTAASTTSKGSAPLDAAEPAAAAGWTDSETHVRVSQPAGFLVRVDVHARVALPPDDVYEILVRGKVERREKRRSF